MTFRADSYPPQIQQALAPVTAVQTPAHQGMTSWVTFAETGLGPVAVKRAAGLRLAAIRRERFVLDALHDSGLPVPETLLYHEIETEAGTEGWLVMRRLPGEPLLHRLNQVAEPEARVGLLTQLGQLVARLHETPVPPALTGEPPWIDSMLAQAEACLPLGLWQGSPEQLDALKQHRPTPVPPVLIHGDLFLDNVITDGTTITGLIDWAFGGVGDPRYDLALAMDEITAEDQAAFLAGYGRSSGLSASETAYFMQLAAFC